MTHIGGNDRKSLGEKLPSKRNGDGTEKIQKGHFWSERKRRLQKNKGGNLQKISLGGEKRKKTTRRPPKAWKGAKSGSPNRKFQKKG